MINLMPFLPSNFGRYNSQSENTLDGSNDFYDSTQIQQKSTTTTTNNIPPLMSLTITTPIMTTHIQQKTDIPISVTKENIEPLPYPSHTPGPIQRPTKLSYTLKTQLSSVFADTPQSPSTPDVLVQINHLLDHQNSITSLPSTTNVSTAANSSMLINDLATPNGSWTPFSPAEWSSKYDASWPLTSPNIPITPRMPNPFTSKQNSPVWPSVIGTPPSNSASSKTNVERTSEWNDIFASTGPSSTETEKENNNTWLKFLPVSDSPRIDDMTTNKQENEPSTPFWNSINLQETPVNPSTTWWPKAPSDEKNTTTNNNNNNNDQSRWDFAR